MKEQAEAQKGREVRSKADIAAHDGQSVTAWGRYRAVAAPRKGPPDPQASRDRAVIVLTDNTEVYLEPIDSPKAKRPSEERQRCEGKKVRVTGTAHRVMPTHGAGLIAPCIRGVGRVTEE